MTAHIIYLLIIFSMIIYSTLTIANLKNIVDDKISLVANVSKKIEAQKEKLRELTHELIGLKQNNQDLNFAVIRVAHERDQLQSQAAELSRKITDLNKSAKYVIGQLHECTHQKDAALNHITTLEKELEACRDTLRHKDDLLAASSKMKLEAQNEVERLSKLLKLKQSASNNKIKPLTTKGGINTK
jgi:chromosome segregation ATPase